MVVGLNVSDCAHDEHAKQPRLELANPRVFTIHAPAASTPAPVAPVIVFVECPRAAPDEGEDPEFEQKPLEQLR